MEQSGKERKLNQVIHMSGYQKNQNMDQNQTAN